MVSIDKVAFSAFGVDIHWYGIIIAFALLVGVVLGVIEAKRRGFRSEVVLDLMLIAIPICVILARVFYVVFAQDASGENPYWKNPGQIIAIWNGGLAIYGAVIGGVVASFIFFKWTRVKVGTMMDIAAPSLVIAQAIGRWGNFVNQEAYGYVINNPKLQWFPMAVYIQADSMWHFATFFYESVWNVLVFIVLMIMRKRVKIRGGIFALYLLFYGIGRFIIEPLRTDSLWLIGGQSAEQVANMKITFGLWFFNDGIRISQVLSLVMILGAILYLVIMSAKKTDLETYRGIYDAKLTPEEVKELRANAKQLRAQDKAEKATKRAQALDERSDAADEKVAKAQAKAEKAQKKLEEFESEIKLSEIKAQVDET
ncbi:MAG: prolipoprotein diacylglyceryl transferase, partial [Clostridia bacterium]|nr:prolipoprotein diacylglyceryl transferase [Clostridia bacterium]